MNVVHQDLAIIMLIPSSPYADPIHKHAVAQRVLQCMRPRVYVVLTEATETIGTHKLTIEMTSQGGDTKLGGTSNKK